MYRLLAAFSYFYLCLRQLCNFRQDRSRSQLFTGGGFGLILDVLPHPSLKESKKKGGWWSVAFRFIRMSYPFFTPLQGQSRSLAIHTCDVTETHPQWLEKRWSGFYTRREKQKKIVKIDAKETRVSITLPQQKKRKGTEREKKGREG